MRAMRAPVRVRAGPADADARAAQIRRALQAAPPRLRVATARGVRDWTLLENAGGSQVPRCVADAMRAHLLENNVQLGAGYPASRRATATVAAAHAWMEVLMGAADAGRVVLGGSTTSLLHLLGDAAAALLAPGDEIVVAEAGHESNIAPWVRAAAVRGATVRWWRMGADGSTAPLDELARLLGPRSRIVAFPHVSNLLGEVVDVAAATQMARAAGALTVVDGVAAAPHRALECAAWHVDFYAMSPYKVFGPHCGALYGRDEAWARLRAPGFYFQLDGPVRGAWELGGAAPEACAGLLAVQPYMRLLAAAGRGAAAPPYEDATSELLSCSRDEVRLAFDAVAALEAPLTARLLAFLRGRVGVRVLGPPPGAADAARVPTVSFTAPAEPAAMVAACAAYRVAIRSGHMYAPRLLAAAGVPPEPGMVRISALHYNTERDLDRLEAALAPLLPPA